MESQNMCTINNRYMEINFISLYVNICQRLCLKVLVHLFIAKKQPAKMWKM